MEKGARPTVAEANESFMGVMHQHRAMRKQMKSVDEEILALQRKRVELMDQQIDLFDGPGEIAAESLSNAWNRAVFHNLQHKLPREIRDMIYAFLWDFDALYAIFVVISMHSHCTNEDYLKRRPPYLDPNVVGQEIAIEAGEAWYKAAARTIPHMFRVNSPEQIEYFICDDPLLIGVPSSAILRELCITLPIEMPALTEDEGLQSEQYYIDLLLKVKRKAGFKLTIKLKQRHIRLESWPKAFNIFRQVLEVFEKEGAQISIRFQYDRSSLFPAFEMDLHGAVKAPDSDWRAEVKAKLDSDDRIKEAHRLYRDEDKPDFDPENEQYDTSGSDTDEDGWHRTLGPLETSHLAGFYDFYDDEDLDPYGAYDDDDDDDESLYGYDDAYDDAY